MLRVVSIEQTSRAMANPNLWHWNETKQSIKLKDLTFNIAEGITSLHKSVYRYINLDSSFSNSECKSKCRNHEQLFVRVVPVVHSKVSFFYLVDGGVQHDGNHPRYRSKYGPYLRHSHP